MQQPTKRLGEMLVEGGLITPAQLHSAITHQKVARGRLGSNLVALGYISEEILMDFLSHQTGVPQMDVRQVDVPPHLLKLVPHRLADQFTVLPISTKEPKSLVLAMSDPSDLNAIDSVRFASGLNVEPVVASHSALRKAISDLYRRLDTPGGLTTVEVGGGSSHEEALAFTLAPAQPVSAPPTAPAPAAFPRDPFFDAPGTTAPPADKDPFALFEPEAPARAVPPVARAQARAAAPALRPLEAYQTRTLVLGLIRHLQRRGLMSPNELEQLLATLVEAGELKDEEKGR